MAYTTSTTAPLPDNPAGLRAVVVLPVQHGQKKPSTRSETACHQICLDHGLSVDAVFLDEGPAVGPRVKLDRPSMRRVFSYLARQQPDALVIYDWDQISRDPRERAEFADRMCAYGIAVYAEHNACAPHLSWDASHDRPQRPHGGARRAG